MSELRLIDDRQDLLTLPRRCLAAIGLHPRGLAPALEGSRRELQHLTGRCETGASGTGLIDTSHHFSALPELDFPSSGSPQSARTFFWSTNKAAASAKAFSLRRSSASSCLISFAC